MNTEIDIEVIYASPLTQTLYQLKVPVGTTAEEAVKISGISEIFPEISLLINKLGIFGRLIDPQFPRLADLKRSHREECFDESHLKNRCIPNHHSKELDS